MVSIVVAIDSKRGIGKNNELLWHIPEDLKRFKQITSGHPVIMGRKTYDSIGRLLPNRTNIIITRDLEYLIDGAIIVHSLEEAIDQASGKPGAEEIFIIGGGQIFAQALPLVHKLYLTIVEGDFGADTFFPEYESIFTKKTFEQKGESGKYLYTFTDLERE
jgi:dihydrofolate reductase